MLKNSEVIQRVQSPYSKGVQSKDTRLTDRHIFSCLISSRAILLQQKANKRQYISQWNYELLPCAELIPAPLHECKGAPNGTLILRTKFKLPKLINSLDRPLILTVETLDGSISFDEKSVESFTYSKGRKFTSLKPFYFIKNGYLYISQPAGLKLIKGIPIVGLFADPIEVHEFPSICQEDEDCADCKCKPYQELVFPLDEELVDAVVKMANQEAINLMKQMESDEMNNARDDDGLKGKMVHQPE